MFSIKKEAEILIPEIAKLLIEKGQSLSIAESCTGGLIAHLITSLAGSSAYFKFAAVTYSNESKNHILDVNLKTIENYGAVSEEVAREMALGALLKGRSDFGLSTTGIAGPGGGSRDKPVGLLCIGLASKNRNLAYKFINKDRQRRENQAYFALLALKHLYEFVLEEK